MQPRTRSITLDKPWLSRYPDDVPETIDPGQYPTLLDMFEQAVERYADKTAFINMGATLSYRELEQRSRAFAAYLQHDLRLQPGSRVALMMPNLLQYPIALYGILRAGMVAVNVNPLYKPRELEHQIKDADVETIVIVTNFAHTLEQVIDNTPIKHVVMTSLGQMLPTVKGKIIDWVVKYIKRKVPNYHLPNAVSMKQALTLGRQYTYERPDVASSDVAFLQYTGGTTGAAKGAVLTHRNMVANVLQAKGAYGPVLSDGDELVVTALPLYHVFALSVNCLLFTEMGGSNLLITNPRDIPGFVKDLGRYDVTAITGVNTLFNALVNNAHFKQLDFTHLRLAVGGGMAVQRAVAEKWKAITGIHLLEGYGLTECSPLVAGNPYDLKDYSGAIGLPVPSTDVRIVDDEGQVLPFDQVGELQVKGPQVMSGYWNNAEATAEVLSDDGWVSTGDMVRIDEMGMIYIVDRKKDMILVSGFNVYPNEIEDVVALHSKVQEVAAIGVPSEATGEAVKVYVVASDTSLTNKELIAHCRQYLTGYKVPKDIEFRQELPKSNVGKILRRELREENDQQTSASS